MFLSFVAAVCAQSPADLFTKAPPHIDQALRDRITKFYQAHVEGKFRVADQYVAEDSKDIFYEADKRRCKAFEIVKITYSEEFRKAQVVTMCDTEMLMMPVGVRPVKAPLTSFWKRENGEWFWYAIPRGAKESPWGAMKPGEKASGSGLAAGAMPPGIMQGPDPAAVFKLVTVDTQQLRFRSDQAATQEVKVSNAMPGSITVEVEPVNFAGIQAKVEKAQVAAGESTKVFVSYQPIKPLPGTTASVRIRILPTGRVIPINVGIQE
jgi:hypothetical protein